MNRDKLPTFDIITFVMASYLLNMFHFKLGVIVQQLLIWTIVGLYIVGNWKYVSPLTRNGKHYNHSQIIVLLLIPFLLLATFPILFTGDFGYVSVLVSMLLLVLYLITIVIRLRKKYPSRDLFESFVFLYTYVTAFYVIISIIFIYVPGVKNAWFSLLDISSYDLRMINNPYYATRVGWMGFSGYNASLKCNISVASLLYIIANNYKKRKRNSILIYVLLLICLAGNVFYARTGLIISILCIGIAIGYIAFVQHNFGKFLILTSLVVALFYISYQYVLRNYQSNLTTQWAFELFYSVYRGEGANASSFSKLQDMYFMPSLSTFLFGDGRYSGAGGGYYMNTDAGIMRGILYFGIIGVISEYLLLMYNLFSIKKASNNILFSLLLLVVFIGFEYKGESTFLLIPITFIISLLIIYKDNKAEVST